MARNLPSDAIETTKGLTREHRFVSARGQSREDSGSDRCHRAVVSLFGVSGRGEQKRGSVSLGWYVIDKLALVGGDLLIGVL